MKPGLRETLKQAVTRVFLAADRAGFHLQPAHYYSSVASRKDLRKRESEWRRPLDPMPFYWNLDDQLEWTRRMVGNGCEMSMQDMLRDAQDVGPFRYGPVEGQFLYSVIRTLQPARVLEIGSGSTTWITSRAVQRNVADGGRAGEIVACDPYTANRVAHLPYVTAKEIGGLVACRR